MLREFLEDHEDHFGEVLIVIVLTVLVGIMYAGVSRMHEAEAKRCAEWMSRAHTLQDTLDVVRTLRVCR